MTNPTPHGQVPDALRLADELEIPIEGYPEATELERNAAAELRRLHAYCQEIESQVILDCMTHVQNPAENEHVAGNVLKNGAEVNMNVYAELPEPDATTVGLGAVWNRHSMRDFADATHALRTQQPAPAAQQAASSAVLKAIREANMQLVRTGDDAFMLVPYKAVTAQAAPSVLEEAARLDFLVEQRAYVVSDPDTCPGYWLHFVHKETGKCWVQADEHPTPRAAIDAARKQGANHD